MTNKTCRPYSSLQGAQLPQMILLFLCLCEGHCAASESCNAFVAGIIQHDTHVRKLYVVRCRCHVNDTMPTVPRLFFIQFSDFTRMKHVHSSQCTTVGGG